MKILNGCRVLESLKLRPSCMFSNLQIDSRSLRELVIESDGLSTIDISAPDLFSLRFSGGFVYPGVRLNGASGFSSLAEAELNFNEPTASLGCFSGQLKSLPELLRVCDFPSQLKFLLELLQHVEKITVGSWCLETLSASEAMGMSSLPSRWRNITVHTTVCKLELPGIMYLLQSSPLLERLVIHNQKSNNTFKNKDFPEPYDFDEKQFWPSQKEFHCVANHLKSVEIIGLEFDSENSKILLALAKFLLKEAVGLEKITIDAELRMSHQGVTIDPHDLRDFHDVIQLQKGGQRASRKAEVIVKYRFNGPRYELRKHKQNTGTQSIPRFA
ncbi:hypothetical protein BT93_E2278 [Corymbia citriodora subsp. variegata]|nr:hypothetical protein BT93_E2278 [Corymbia citriodora subsp. variegata]